MEPPQTASDPPRAADPSLREVDPAPAVLPETTTVNDGSTADDRGATDDASLDDMAADDPDSADDTAAPDPAPGAKDPPAKPLAASDDQHPPTAPQPPVCERLAAKAGPTGLASAAQAFDGPNGDGRGGAKGVLLPAPADWQKSGTIWKFNYERGGSAYGLQIIHPFKQGQVLVSLFHDVAIVTSGYWDEVGWSDPPSTVPIAKLPVLATQLPLQSPTAIASRLDAKGNYTLELGGQVVVRAKIDVVLPMRLAIRPDSHPRAVQGYGNPQFAGAGLPRAMATGEAALLLGPLDNGVHAASAVQLELLPPLKAGPGNKPAPRPAAGGKRSIAQVQDLFALDPAEWKVEKGVLSGSVGSLDLAPRKIVYQIPQPVSSVTFEFKIKAKWHHLISIDIDGQNYDYIRGHWNNVASRILVAGKEEPPLKGIVSSPDDWCRLRVELKADKLRFFYDGAPVWSGTVPRGSGYGHAVRVGFNSHETTLAVKDFVLQFK